MKKILVIWVILMVLMSSIVLAAELSKGQTVSSGDTLNGVTIPSSWSGKTVQATSGNNAVKVNGQWYFSDGYKTFDSTGREIKSNGAPGSQAYNFVYYTDEKGKVQHNYYKEKVEQGTVFEPGTSYSFNAKTDQTVTQENIGDTTFVKIGETTFTYKSGTPAEEVNWASATEDQLKNKEFTLSDKSTLKFSDNLGEDGSEYTRTSADKKTEEKFKYQNNQLIPLKETKEIEIGGQAVKASYDYEKNEVDVQGKKYDSQVWAYYTGDKDIKNIDKDGTVHFDDGESLKRKGNIYEHYDEDNKLVGKTDVLTEGEKVTRTTEIYINDKLTPSRKEISVSDKDIEYRQSFDKDGQLSALMINQPDKKVTLQGEVLNNYLGEGRKKKVLSKDETAEIAEAAAFLGDYGKYTSDDIYTTQTDPKDDDYKEYIPAASSGEKYTERVTYENNQDVQRERKYTGADQTKIAGESLNVAAGDEVIITKDQKTNQETTSIISKDVVTYSGNDQYLTKVEDNLYGEGKIYSTTYKGDENTDSLPVDFYSSEQSTLMLSSRPLKDFTAFDRTTGEVKVYDTQDKRYIPASQVYTSDGQLKQEYAGGRVKIEKDGGNAPEKIDAGSLESLKGSAKGAAEQQNQVEEKNEELAQEKAKKELDLRISFWQSGALNVFAGMLGKYRSNAELSNLLFEKTDLYDWREDVDRIFARNYLGKPYVASAICQSYWDVESESTAVIETPDGLVQFIGHVEGDRSPAEPIICSTSQECADLTNNPSAKCQSQNKVCVDSSNKVILQYFYKITYGVRAPTDEKLTPHKDEKGAISFNIIVKGPGGIRPLYSEYIELFNGQTKNDFFVQYSPRAYDQVCIWFGKKPKTIDYKAGPGFGQQELREEICNSFVETDKSKVNFENNPGQQPGQSGAVTLTI